MKFGTRLENAPTATNRGTGSRWIKTFKEGDTHLRFLQEMTDWVMYYEHWNPEGTYFPCTGDRARCPGCTSSNERMKQASKKTACNALVGEYVDVYKLPWTLVQRLQKRSDNNNKTITDRSYTITRIGMDKSTEYDVESGNAAPIDVSAYQLHDIEEMLATAFRENFPDYEADQILEQQRQFVPKEEKKTSTMDVLKKIVEPKAQAEDPPSEPAVQSNADAQGAEVEITLDELQKMTPEELKTLCASNGAPVPAELAEQDEIIRWMSVHFG